jgi:hypothetical protein
MVASVQSLASQPWVNSNAHLKGRDTNFVDRECRLEVRAKNRRHRLRNVSDRGRQAQSARAAGATTIGQRAGNTWMPSGASIGPQRARLAATALQSLAYRMLKHLRVMFQQAGRPRDRTLARAPSQVRKLPPAAALGEAVGALPHAVGATCTKRAIREGAVRVGTVRGGGWNRLRSRGPEVRILSGAPLLNSRQGW